MKGIIRIGCFEIFRRVYPYYCLMVRDYLLRRIKRSVGSSGVKSFHIFYGIGTYKRFRVDYITVSCPDLYWEKLREELVGRYQCLESHLRMHKRGRSMCRIDVDFYEFRKICENRAPGIIIDEDDPPIRRGGTWAVHFKIIRRGIFYKDYTDFISDIKKTYRENAEFGTYLIQSELEYVRDGRRKKNIGWKVENGNFRLS